MDRFIFAFFCLILAWSPLPLGSNRTWSVSLLEMMIATLFCLWLFSIRDHDQISPALRKNKTIIALFLLIPLWTVLQLIPLPPNFLHFISPNTSYYYQDSAWHAISLDRESTLYSLQRSFAYALFFVLTLAILNTPQRLETIAQLVVISGVVQASYGVIVATGGKSFDFLHIVDLSHHAGSATGTFVNSNHLAGYLEMSIAFGIGLLITLIIQSQNNYAGLRARFRDFIFTLLSGKARLRVFLALMVVAMVLSHSRMGNFAFFASMGISGAIGLWIYRKNVEATSLFVLFSSLIVIDIFILGAWFGLDKLAERLQETDVIRDERLIVYMRALETLRDFWLTGSGSGSYATVFPRYRSDQLYGFFDFAHNDYLQISIEYGLIGFALFAAIVIYSFKRAIQAQMYRRTPMLKSAGFAAMMGIMSLMIHSTTDFNLYIPANALLFILLCAFACIAHTMEHQQHTRHKPVKKKLRMTSHTARQ